MTYCGHRQSEETRDRNRQTQLRRIAEFGPPPGLQKGWHDPAIRKKASDAKKRPFTAREDALVIAGCLFNVPFQRIADTIGCCPQTVQRRAAELAKRWMPPDAAFVRPIWKPRGKTA